MTEKMLTGTLRLNTNKQTFFPGDFFHPQIYEEHLSVNGERMSTKYLLTASGRLDLYITVWLG